MKLKKLKALPFTNHFTECLPADVITDNYCRQVQNACFSFVTPKDFSKASLISYSSDLAEELGLSPKECETEEFVKVFSGSQLLPQMTPYATCYGGHQFGNWAGQLGDGRAINLSEVQSPSGQIWTLQLKGAGPTPYSRAADGLAVLRSSVREYLCSEAMYYLGVPTTRALCLLNSGESVQRDMFYDGNPKLEPGAIVCRAAQSFIRFGSFELPINRNDINLSKQLADYTIFNFFNYLEVPVDSQGKPTESGYLKWFEEVCELTCKMIVHWMRIGFVHGVMNTDNMSILGLTIDYGPYGWLENYDPNWTPNTTDAQGRRYRFGQQAQIGLWNLLQLANAIYPLINESGPLEAALEKYKTNYDKKWREMMLSKIGLETYHAESDDALIQDLLETLQTTETDMTLFFRSLADFDANLDLSNIDTDSLLAPIKSAFYQIDIEPEAQQAFVSWFKRYHQRLQLETLSNAERKQKMNAINPLYVLRNYLAQLAIDKSEQGDNSMIEEILRVFKTPYTQQAGKEHLAAKRPEWARKRAGCSMLSCSS